LPAPTEIDDKPDFVARSVTLASDVLGIIAKMDLIEGEDGTVTAIDTKKGKRPHVAEGAYEPERVQVCAQALILEEAIHGRDDHVLILDIGPAGGLIEARGTWPARRILTMAFPRRRCRGLIEACKSKMRCSRHSRAFPRRRCRASLKQQCRRDEGLCLVCLSAASMPRPH
jgi:hypothetical protein